MAARYDEKLSCIAKVIATTCKHWPSSAHKHNGQLVKLPCNKAPVHHLVLAKGLGVINPKQLGHEVREFQDESGTTLTVCVRCGGWSQRRRVKLARPCLGRRQDGSHTASAARRVLKRVAAGKHPANESRIGVVDIA